MNRKIYQPIIRFDTEEILDSWCDCAAGSRFIGYCSNIASAVWFLSFERWQTRQRRAPSATFINFVSDAGVLPDLFDSTDESDDEDEN